MHVKNITEKLNLLKMCGPQMRLCLFTFRPIASKQLNSLTTNDNLSWLGGAEVTHSLWVREVPGSIHSSGKGFDVSSLLFCPKSHYLSQKFAIYFTMWIYLVYLFNICDWLWGFKDTDLASLTCHIFKSWQGKKMVFHSDHIRRPLRLEFKLWCTLSLN